MMEDTAKKQLILSLIRDDLINLRLIHTLNDLGLDAGAYMLHLGETVFGLMGFPDASSTDALYDLYYAFSRQACHVDISQSHAPLDPLAAEIYEMLEGGRNAFP